MRTWLSLRSAASILLIGVCSRAIVAQANPAPTMQPFKLTLKQAVELALKQNPRVVAAHLLLLESESDRQISLSALLPKADLVANGARKQYNFQSVEFLPNPKAAGPFAQRLCEQAVNL